ncbi:hypothetical protein Pmani_026387 [Petrolisthes manimaculis]|uniref:Uncharacterized protein n=1 Tax=Petrolisthes manimaculis TaxID=1843537 RepID=A0AAE1P470_9EUCA|nr:hypothetical protein Pmani_026387 [Petrolisthes manimaculis]
MTRVTTTTTNKMAEGSSRPEWQELCDISSFSRDIMFPVLPQLRAELEPVPLLQEYTEQVVSLAAMSAISIRESHPKQQGFSSHLQEKDNLDFFRNLRVTKDTFQLILGIVEEAYQPISNRGTVLVSPQECVQMGLWWHGEKQFYC